MPGGARDLGVRDMLDGVGSTGVFRDPRIVEIHLASFLIQHDVLQDGPEPKRLINLRLPDVAEMNGLRVTSAFNVEHSVVRPAMLVITDQPPFRISGERRFACARKAEEYG